MSIRTKIIFYSVLIALILSVPAREGFAQAFCPLDSLKPIKVTSLESFAKIPVLNKGRIKPMETYAQNFLLLFSGKRRYEKESAIQWFSRYFFAPRTTYNDKIFLINNPEILEAIKVEPEKKRRYSYHQLEEGHEKLRSMAEMADKIDNKNRSAIENEIIRVFNNLRLYVRTSGATAFSFPHPDFKILSDNVIQQLGLEEGQNEYSFYDVLINADKLIAASNNLSQKNYEQWNEDEKTIGGLMNALFFWTKNYSNCPIGLIPTQNHNDERWLSPMDIIATAFSSETHREEVRLIRQMNIHYWNGEHLEFDLAVRNFINTVNTRLSPKEKKAVKAIPKELFYNTLKPFLWAKLLYGLAFILFLCSLLGEKKWMYRTTWALTLGGFTLHLSGLIIRILILSRPPVSNLYETFIFVGFISVLLGIIIEVINKNWIGLAVTNICGIILLFIAGKFSAEGDTLQVLVAVLNSNFWLSTHVTSITIGYAGCSVAGIIGHIYILQALAQPNNKKRLASTMSNMLGALGFGLTMTFLGTALGGIWADQSWGRFWGWDPKENGALLIILWSAIIFHARLSKMINPLGVAVANVLGLIVVMWAWFGVNLLSVGLHSYGFTSGIANTLIGYVLLELIFLVAAIFILGKKNIKI